MRYVCIFSELSVKSSFKHQNWVKIWFLALVIAARGNLRSYDTKNPILFLFKVGSMVQSIS